ncbi:2-hydroxyacid dehydrogenase [Vreelandella olivaria]|uniref:2-hydroxyacid dehydrogenase n=1 Tax=Vreelandella olivaria TaxID=390919 RepID=UPI00201EB104|nr:glyoxylate/hydroxypyruvate reductase A [Halomonas olivaria]
MTRIALVGHGKTLDILQAQLPDLAPAFEVVRIAHGKTCDNAEVAICWHPPQGSFARLPKLRLVHSIAAGCDHILADTSLPPEIPVCRIVDGGQQQGMAEFALWAVLHYHRRMDQVIAQRTRHHWFTPLQAATSACRVGVMGLGALGTCVAERLASHGFSVRGWARTPKHLAGVECFVGMTELNEFLEGLDILICLLPLTPDTHGILNTAVMSQLAQQAVLINLGRGEHLVRPDLTTALDSGQLRGALLDVFDTEPLPTGDPLWSDKRVLITPHMASSSSSNAIAKQVIDNIQRLMQGRPLRHTINHQGY